jgi:hypothetical protein
MFTPVIIKFFILTFKSYSFPGDIAAEAWIWPLQYSAEIKNAWSNSLLLHTSLWHILGRKGFSVHDYVAEVKYVVTL